MMNPSSRTLPQRLAMTALLVVAFQALAAQASFARSTGWRVAFTTGSTLDVQSYALEEGRVILFLQDGGTFAVDAARVRGMQPVVLPEAPASPPSPSSDPARAASGDPAPPAPDPAPVPIVPAPAAPSVAGQPQDIDTLIRDAAQRHGLEADLLAAVIAVESGYRVDAVSPKGAQGLMQLMPGTARELAVTDAFDPAQNIDAGARHLKRLIDQNGGTWWRALAAYNAGEGTVARYRGLPPYRETMSYVKKVLDRYGKSRSSAKPPVIP